MNTSRRLTPFFLFFVLPWTTSVGRNTIGGSSSCLAVRLPAVLRQSRQLRCAMEIACIIWRGPAVPKICCRFSVSPPPSFYSSLLFFFLIFFSEGRSFLFFNCLIPFGTEFKSPYLNRTTPSRHKGYIEQAEEKCYQVLQVWAISWCWCLGQSLAI